MKEELNLPKILYNIAGTFEFELLIELILRYWEHPFADDPEFRNTLFEEAAVVLRQSSDGVSFGELPPKEVNLVFAIWHVESSFVSNETNLETKKMREKWLATIKQRLPSCFCSQDLLD